MAILAAVEEGIRPTGAEYEVIENRREAIRQAMEMAVGGDIIVLAGDISWGMSLEQSLPDFQFIDALPGKKILLNSIYWLVVSIFHHLPQK